MTENKLTISNHHKIPVTSPGLVFGQKPFFVGLFWESLLSVGFTTGMIFSLQEKDL